MCGRSVYNIRDYDSELIAALENILERFEEEQLAKLIIAKM